MPHLPQDVLCVALESAAAALLAAVAQGGVARYFESRMCSLHGSCL